MTKAIRFETPGGSDVLQFVDIDLPAPAAGQVRIRHTAIGVNFIDTYHRTGLYPLPMPSGLGSEAAGVVEAVGEGVTRFKAGDRVGYGSGFIGSYSEAANVPADRLVKLPEGVSDEVAAASLLKGMTAQYLLRRTFKVEKGQTILVHAAAGGVGQILCQWANYLGATVIGTVGSADKAKIARENGCHHTILYRDEDFVARVNEITKGAKCDVVYDGVGKATFPASLDCIRPMGMFVSYGNASGAIEAFNILLLLTKGSLFATRPTLVHYGAKREDVLMMAKEVMDVVGKGVVKIPVNQTYALKDAAQAHRDLEARKTTGSTVLLP